MGERQTPSIRTSSKSLWPRRSPDEAISRTGRTGEVTKRVGQAHSPLLAKEGWTRPKENAAKHPLIGADGVVVSSYRLFIPNGFVNRWLETTTPSAPLRNGAIS